MALMGGNIASSGLRGGADLGFNAAFGGVHFEFATSSGDVKNPPVGDHWSIALASAVPGGRVTVLGTRPDGSVSEALEGFADGYGQFRKDGQFTQGQLGSWSEVWKVNGVEVGHITFTVRPPSDMKNVPPAALLKPMPSIIPVKPGQVSSSQTGLGCQLASWVNANPIGGIVLALGVGWLLKKGFK